MKTEKLDRLYSVSSAAGKGFAHARGYGPFDGMEFMEHLPAAFRKGRLEFWKNSPMAPGLAIDDYGSKWPDVLACNDPLPAAFFSQKVLNDLAAHHIRPWKIAPIPIGEILSNKLRSIPAPDYFLVEVATGIQIDYPASGIETDANGSPRISAGQIAIPQFDPETWSGLEIFSCSNGLGGPTSILCTERVKRIAQDAGWTNVAFARQRIKGIDPFTGRSTT